MSRKYKYPHCVNIVVSIAYNFCYITLFFVFFIANIHGQTQPKDIIVDYSVKNKPLKNVLIDLAKRTNINISFSDELIPVDSIISFNYKRKPLTEVLELILIKTNAEVKILEGDILLVQKKIDENQLFDLYGYIQDSNSGERLINALVYFPKLNRSTVSNDFGFYSIKIPRGELNLVVQYLAYEELEKNIKCNKDIKLDLFMTPLAMLNEIIIKNKYDQSTYSSNQGYEIPLEMIHSFIAIGGETNVMKIIGSAAGVSSAADQISGISVRGGNTSHNLVLLDGVPVFNANHALGLYSIFNSDILKSVKFYKGAFPSRYSGRLSSVIDVKTREGNSKKFIGNISLGTFSAKANIEGPIIKDKASFLISYRRSTIDPWIKSVLNLSNQDNSTGVEKEYKGGNYYLYDFNLKFNYKLNRKNQIYLSAYIGKDDYRFNKNLEDAVTIDSTIIGEKVLSMNWSNGVYSFRLNTQWNNNLFSNLTAYTTQYVFNSFDLDYVKIKTKTLDIFAYDSRFFKSDLTELGLKSDFDYTGLKRHYIKFGTKFTKAMYSPGLSLINENNDIIADSEVITQGLMEKNLNPYNQSVIGLSAYFEDEILLHQNLFMNIGANASGFAFDNRTVITLDPRISIMFKSGDFNLLTSYSKMSQFNHLLRNRGLGLPFKIWIPSAHDMELENAWIATIGVSYLYKESTKFGFELYYKKMFNQYSFKEGLYVPINDSSNWFDVLPSGNSTAGGFEFTVLRNVGKTVFDLNYTYSYVVNYFEELNQGREFDSYFDRRHMLNISIARKINKNAEFSANWRLASGNPVTLGGTPFLVHDNEDVPSIKFFTEGINNYRLPVYHRLDIGFNIYSDFSWGKQKIGIGIVNAYNRKNPYYLDVKLIGEDVVKYSQWYLVPLLPSITYSISFK